MHLLRASVASLLITSLLLSGCAARDISDEATENDPAVDISLDKLSTDTTISISDKLAADFEMKDLENLQAVQDKWGAFSEKELDYLTQHKFLIKEVQDTKLTPTDINRDYGREFLALYNSLRGQWSEYERKTEDAVFLSADVFFNTYGNLYRELLKEIENTKFVPELKQVSEAFYKAAEKNLAAAKTAEKKRSGKM